MAAKISLVCWVLGPEHGNAFLVDILPSKTVVHLKDAIKKKKDPVLNHIAADQLEIWKLSTPIPTRDIAEILGTIGTGKEISDADKLDPGKQLSSYFPETPVDMVCLVAEVPTKSWSPRTNTVEILYEKLRHYKLMQVRGTPASGKTILLHLLWAHILAKEPGAKISTFVGWHKDELEIRERLQERIPNYPQPATTTYLLFDNAQDTYWDPDLWEVFFKHIEFTPEYRVVLFCSYGSAGIRPLKYTIGTSMTLEPPARVSLVPSSEQEDKFGTIGLLFSQEEFDQVITRRRLALHCDLKDKIFLWTKGHAGAVASILDIIEKAAEVAERQRSLLDLKSFLKLFPFDELLHHLSYAGGWARGLPEPSDLEDADVANMFRGILATGYIKDATSSAVVQFCHNKGWIFSVSLDDHEVYVFPSPLHRVYLEWLLPSSTVTAFTTPLDMSLAAIQRFQPSQLAHPSGRVGDAGAARPLEATYQDEFYRSIFDITGGCVRLSSEYSPANGALPGRIDFFIPSKKWGVELLRDGKKLQDHSSQFLLGGAYGAWLESTDMTDYIILDFRRTRPQKAHNGIEKFYHVVFNENFNFVEILNNNLESVTEFALVEHQLSMDVASFPFIKMVFPLESSKDNGGASRA